MHYALEVVVIPVSDVDRSKEFYERLGWRLDADLASDNGFRAVQFTPPGSGCSIQFGTKITSSTAHGEHEKRIGRRDENWPDWYAAYMVAERAGTELPT